MYGFKIKILGIFALGLILLISITQSSVVQEFRIALVDSVSSSFSGARGIADAAAGYLPFAAYRREIKRLNDQRGLLSQEILRLRSITAENERLREVLGFKKSTPFTTIAAQVIGRDPSNWANSLIIDKGSLGSLRVGMAVISVKGLAGKLVEVGRNSSKVLLITDPDCKVGGVLEKSRQGGMVVGTLGGMCKMVYISLDTRIENGEKVMTAGYGTVFPKGLVIGEVVSSGKEPGRLYRYAMVKPSQDLSRIEEVLCIR